MKKNYKKLLSLGLCLTVATAGFSQAINESFDDITTLAASGWVENNLSTPIGTQPTWFQGDNTVFPSNSGATGNEYIGVNYNSVAGAATISNWLISPARTLNNGDVVTFFTRTVGTPAYADNLQVRLSVNGTSTNVGTTSSSVGDFSTLLLEINPTLNLTAYPSAWTQYSFTVSGLPMAMTGRLAFRYFVINGGPTGANSDFIGIDDFVYTPAGSAAADVTVNKNNHEYTIVPLSQVTPLAIGTTVNNVGSAATTDAVLTANVYMAPDFVTPVQTFTSPATAIAMGGNSAISLGTYTPTAIGDYVVEYYATCTGNTVAANDSSAYLVTVDDNEYARDNGNISSSFGIGAGPVGYLGSMYTVTTGANLDSVLVAISKPGTSSAPGDGVGDMTRVVVYDVVAGLPNAIIGNSANYVFTPADTLGLVVTTHAITAVGGGSLVLAPGTYFVSVEENNTNVGLAFCADEFRTNTVYASWVGQAWSAVENFGAAFAKTPVIRPYLNTCAPIDNTTSLSGLTITANQAGATYQWIDCGTSAPIAGETGASYTATANGNYAVVITMGSCSDTSACQNISSVGIANNTAAAALAVYPNPSTGVYQVELSENAVVVVTNVLGATIINETMVKGTQKINIQNQPKGVYLLKVITENGQHTSKLIKE